MRKAWVVVPAVFLASVLFAQDRGTITGIVNDASGAAVPEATVRVTNPATGLQQSTASGADGLYTVPYLPVGDYVVSASKAGFRTAESRQIRVSVNTTTRVDLSLQVGEIQQTVEVTGAAPLVQSERSDLGKIFNSKAITDLPLTLSGGLRNNLEFVLLTPGVTATPGDNLSIRIGGGLSAGHSMLLDGAEANSERRNDPSFQSVSTDAIAEFKVITNSYSAEYGRTSNGIVNFTTKSGTNAIHGSLFEYFRNDKLNARGFFSPTRAIVRQNNFGGTVGGPVFLPKIYNGKNKSFFFFSYEKAIFRQGSPSGLTSVPPTALREGDFSGWVDAAGAQIPIYDPRSTRVEGGQIVRQVFPGNQIPGNLISPVARVLNKYLPAPTLPGLTRNINVVGNPGANQDVWSIKGDHAFSERNRISGLFSRQFFGAPDATGPIPGPLGENFNSQGVNKFYRVNHDLVITPRLLNHFTFGWNKRDVIEYFPARYEEIPQADRAMIELKGAFTETRTGLRRPPPAYNLGDGYPRLGFWIDTLSPSRTWNINEQVAWMRGSHSLKFGFTAMRQDYRRVDCNVCMGDIGFSRVTTGLPGAAGQTGSSYASFLLGMASGGTVNPYGGDFSFGQPYYAWFVQDDWKATRKLTLNLGLRYELPFPKQEKDGQQSNLCLHCPNPAAGNLLGALEFAGDGPGRTGRPRFIDTRLNAWGPRLGLAYEVMPRLVVRAGAGLYYVPMKEGANADRGTNGFGGNRSVPSPDGGVTPAFLLSDGFGTFPRPPFIDPGLDVFRTVPFMPRYAGLAPKMYDWNFTIEKGLGGNAVVRASYQATTGVALFSTRELINQVDPRYLSLGPLLSVPVGSDAAREAGIALPWPGFEPNRSVAQALRPLPQYTGIDRAVDSDTTGHSTYHALTVSAERRYSKGLWFMTSYTFSKLISNTQGENPALGGFVANGDIGTQNGYDRRADKAISNQDVPHHLVLAYSYELPVGRGKKYLANSHPFVRGVLGGWKLSGVQNYQSGYPMRVTSNQNPGIFAGTIRANYAGGEAKNPAYQGDPNQTFYINRNAFVRPPNFTFGNTAANLAWLRSPGMLREDITLGKDFFLFSEERRLEFKSSFFNIFNRTQFGGIDQGVESTSFGLISSQVNRPREIQFSLRLVF